MSLTVTHERKVGDSHGVTPSTPVHQLRRNGGCADVAVELRGASHRAPAPTLLLPPSFHPRHRHCYHGHHLGKDRTFQVLNINLISVQGVLGYQVPGP